MKVTRNELRLGNLLDFEGEVCIVREIDSSGAVVLFNNNEEDWIDLFQFSGIPLTEEWLLKFGFEEGEWKDKTSTQYLYHANDTLHISDSRDVNYSFESPCKYVHQLQNIFFCLCGKELTINKTNDPL